VSRATRYCIAVGSALASHACGLVGGSAPPPPARGVVLVLAPGSVAGSARTPALKHLAGQGRAFDSAFAPDPDPARARAALLGEADASLETRLAAQGVAVERLGGGWRSEAGAARLESWLREPRRFLLLASVGPEPGAAAGVPPPALLAGAFAPPLPRIAVADLAFSDAPGGETRPPAWSEPARRRAEAAHLARALAADAELQALVALVERAAPDAAFVVVTDPSPDTGAHGRLERGDALFDDTLQSSIVVRAGGLNRPGRPSGRLVSTLDVVPTLFELLGLRAEAAHARSLMPLLADPRAARDAAVVSSVPRKAGRLGRSVRSPRHRYTEWPDGSRELYDHVADPGENHNLSERPEHAAAADELRRVLRSSSPVAPGSDPETSKARRLPAPARNVVLIVVDDLNARIGAWGAPVKTPAIDRLAARGVRFERAYAQVAMCSPSRVSLLTGWRPERTGVWQNEDPPRPRNAVPLQELFAAHGAFAVSIGKIYHSPADFTWDLREDHPDLVEERDPSAAGEGLAGLWVKAAGGDLDQPDGRRARRAAALVAGAARRPFFLALGLVRPHVRWVAPERYFGLYPPESIAPVPYPADDLADVPAIAVKTLPQPLPGLPLRGREPPGLVPGPDFRRQAIAAYQACVSFADAQVGSVLDALERHERFRDSVVVLVGDNGFHLGEHGGLLRKDTLFEEALRVPLVIAAPDLARPGDVVQAPVELLDLYPTIVELAGLPLPAGLDGRSLAASLVGGEPWPDVGYARSWRRVQPPERGYSLRSERLRYTLWPDGSEELYERRGSSPEAENLAARPERSAEKARLRARLESLVAPQPEAARRPAPAP
jgi:uncharacterized sulfatase